MDLEPESGIGSGPVMPAGLAIFVTVTAMTIGLLLNGPDILETALRQEAGWKRTVAVAAAEPFAAISRTLFLDRPHELFDLALGREPPEPITTTTVVAAPTTTAPSITTTTAGLREVTAADPLRLFIGGDSMVGQFGPMLQNEALDTGLIEVTQVQYEFSSGLTRDDFLDWPSRLVDVIAEQDPDAIVLFFGGNDAQAIRVDGVWHDYGTETWLSEYRRRVRDLMTQLTEAGRDVYWMGMPLVRSAEFQQKVDVMNGIYRSEAEAFDGVTFVDSYEVFAGSDGAFSEYLTDDNGDLVDMRLNDGVHLTTAGGIRLAKVTLGVIAANWGLS
ncbi:MAG: SGNH/GDSL hydrolase family protein [Acidimicrobiia bacterium]